MLANTRSTTTPRRDSEKERVLYGALGTQDSGSNRGEIHLLPLSRY